MMDYIARYSWTWTLRWSPGREELQCGQWLGTTKVRGCADWLIGIFLESVGFSQFLKFWGLSDFDCLGLLVEPTTRQLIDPI